MKVGLFIVALVAVAVIVARQEDELQLRVRPSTVAQCPSGARPIGGTVGWEIGPVQVMLPSDVLSKGLVFPSGSAVAPELAFWKVLLLFNAEVGTKYIVQGWVIDSLQKARFTHGLDFEAESPPGSLAGIRENIDNAQSVNSGVLPDRRNYSADLIDIPGYMVFDTPGCYQVFVTVEDEMYGPFGVLVARSQ